MSSHPLSTPSLFTLFIQKVSIFFRIVFGRHLFDDTTRCISSSSPEPYSVQLLCRYKPSIFSIFKDITKIIEHTSEHTQKQPCFKKNTYLATLVSTYILSVPPLRHEVTPSQVDAEKYYRTLMQLGVQCCCCSFYFIMIYD